MKLFVLPLLLLLPLAAFAGDAPPYGVAVWNAKGEFVASKWPDVSQFVLG